MMIVAGIVIALLLFAVAAFCYRQGYKAGYIEGRADARRFL